MGLKYFLLGAECTWGTLLNSPIKLSNSGESLKLLVLIKNYMQFIYTIINRIMYYCGVKIYKIFEKKMGNRGSKSDFINKSLKLKEQRVNGSWWNKPFHLKYTLMDCENNYQFNNHSKQIILSKKNFSTLNNQTNINPYFVTGLKYAEGCFNITLIKRKKENSFW